MNKEIIMVIIGLLLFVTLKLLIVETIQLTSFTISCLLYIVGLHWIFAYFNKQKMFAPYIELHAEDENKIIRFTLSVVGFALCIAALLT